MTISAKRVRELVMDCLFTDKEAPGQVPPKYAKMVDGIMQGFAFHPWRLLGHHAEVAAMVAYLPREFRPADKGGGGGWTFLNMCKDKDGNQWGEHPSCEELYCLAAGLGMAKFLMPREEWGKLPGSMPYILLDHEGLQCN